MSEGLVDPDMIPKIDTSYVTNAANDLRNMGTSVSDNTDGMKTAWSGLQAGGVYEAPESASVYGLLDSSVTAADSVESALSSAAGAMDDFAETLDGIKTDLDSVRSDAVDFREKALKGRDVPKSTDVSRFSMGEYAGMSYDTSSSDTEHKEWYDIPEMCDENNKLLARINDQVAKIINAEDECANTLHGLIPDKCFESQQTDITGEALDGLDSLPWGKKTDYEPKNCGESAALGVCDGIAGLLEGGASLISYNPRTGQWGDWDYAGQAWTGLGDLVVSIAVTASPLSGLSNAMSAFGVDNSFTQFVSQKELTVANTVTSLVNIDLTADDPFAAWKKDGVRSLFSSATNIGTFFIPGADAGSVLKLGAEGASTAAKAGNLALRTAGTVADMIVPGGSFAVEAAGKFGVRVADTVTHSGEGVSLASRASQAVENGALHDLGRTGSGGPAGKGPDLDLGRGGGRAGAPSAGEGGMAGPGGGDGTSGPPGTSGSSRSTRVPDLGADGTAGHGGGTSSSSGQGGGDTAGHGGGDSAGGGSSAGGESSAGGGSSAGGSSSGRGLRAGADGMDKLTAGPEPAEPARPGGPEAGPDKPGGPNAEPDRAGGPDAEPEAGPDKTGGPDAEPGEQGVPETGPERADEPDAEPEGEPARPEAPDGERGTVDPSPSEEALESEEARRARRETEDGSHADTTGAHEPRRAEPETTRHETSTGHHSDSGPAHADNTDRASAGHDPSSHDRPAETGTHTEADPRQTAGDGDHAAGEHTGRPHEQADAPGHDGLSEHADTQDAASAGHDPSPYEAATETRDVPDHHEPDETPAHENQTNTPDNTHEQDRLGWDTATDWPDRPDVTRADGRTEVHHDGGQSVVHEGGGQVTVTDGDVSVRSSSEGVQISHPGGDITVDSKGRLTGVPDDAVVVKGRRKTWTLETSGPDPIRVSRDADGVVTVSHGDTTVRELKGVTVADAGDGLYTKAYPDGTTQVTQVDAAGGSTTLFDDGSTLHRYPDGAFEIYGDPGLKHGAHDYDGTVDPSAGLSESGLTHNGKLDDPAHVPDAIQNLVDKGVVSIDEKGVVRVNQKVTESFTLPETAESYRQVGLQERGMNDLTQHIREDNMYARGKDKNWGKADIARYRREAEQHLTDYFQGEGLPPDKARSLAKDTLAHHEALHGPDRVIGGNPDNLTGFGKDTTPGNTVNSAMGRHWASGDAVREFNRRMNDAFQDIPKDLRGDVRVNTEFQVNNKTTNFTGLP